MEVDGVEHEGVVADSIQIYAAQRYSFIVSYALVEIENRLNYLLTAYRQPNR